MNKLKEDHKREIHNIRLEYALEKAIAESGARTSKAVKAMLDTDKIYLDETGQLVGAKEQLNTLKTQEDTEYLFNNKEDITFKGVSVGISEKQEKGVEDMSYDEICAYLERGSL